MRIRPGGRTFRTYGAVVLAGLATALGGVTAVPAPALAASCDPDTQTRGDLDGDGTTDAVVGMPFYSDGAGAVDVRYTGLPSKRISAGTIGVGTGEGDSFGSALAVGDLDGDGCADLVIGALREGPFDDPDAVGGYIGQVHILFGSPTGLLSGSTVTLPHAASSGNNFDDFGAALALGARRLDGGDLVHDLYVGAPGAEIDGHAGAGEVFHYVVEPAGGSDRVTIATPSVYTQNSPGVPGAAEAGDRFGAVLAADDYVPGVVAAAPLEDVGSARNAGTIWYLGLDGSGAAGAPTSFSQDSTGVPGSAESGDHFGLSLSMRGRYLSVGVPDEDAGSRRNTGAVQTFRQAASGRLAPGRAISQDSTGVPGTPQAGDRFGAAVATGQALICQEVVGIAIGAPGQDVGSRANAGTVTAVPWGTGSGCKAKVLRQGAGLAGAAEAGDQVGGVLGITRGRIDLDEDYSDRLLIGVPLEDVGANADAGIVQPARDGITVNGTNETSLLYSGGYLNTDRYGMVLSSASD